MGARRVSQYPPAFRGLSDAFLDALDQLITAPEGGWWRDVLAHPDLILAVRSEALNVYHRGASLFRIDFSHGRPTPVTHVKYLVRQRQTLIRLAETGAFVLDPAHALWSTYAGPETLAEMIRAARRLVGPEKTGVHALVQASPNVVDVEIALEGEYGPELETEAAAATLDPTTGPVADEEVADTAVAGVLGKAKPTKPAGPRQDRIDVASLEERGHPEQAWLVFHEAKHYDNTELKADPKRRPKIADQVARYTSSIRGNAGGLHYSYPHVCRARVRRDAMRRKVRSQHPAWPAQPHPAPTPLIREVADGTRDLKIETQPRLVVFGFDADQRDGAWSAVSARLTQLGLRVYAIGNPQGLKQSAAFRRPADVKLTTPEELAAEAQKAAPPPTVIPLPVGGPAVPCLYFMPGKGEVLPVYLCNPTDTPLTGVSVTCGSPTNPELAPVRTAPAGADGTVAPGTSVLVDRYGLMWDGDALILYEVAITDANGPVQRSRALVDKGGPAAAWVTLQATAADS